MVRYRCPVLTTADWRVCCVAGTCVNRCLCQEVQDACIPLIVVGVCCCVCVCISQCSNRILFTIYFTTMKSKMYKDRPVYPSIASGCLICQSSQPMNLYRSIHTNTHPHTDTEILHPFRAISARVYFVGACLFIDSCLTGARFAVRISKHVLAGCLIGCRSLFGRARDSYV